MWKCRGRAVKSQRIQTLVFLISRVWVRIPKCKEPSALIAKWRGLLAPMIRAVAAVCAKAPWNPCKVLTNWVSEFITSVTFNNLSESLYTQHLWVPCLVRALYYYYYHTHSHTCTCSIVLQCVLHVLLLCLNHFRRCGEFFSLWYENCPKRFPWQPNVNRFVFTMCSVFSSPPLIFF